MQESLIHLIEVATWSGFAALGFGILFNIPRSAMVTVFCLGFLGGFIKFLLTEFELNIIIATFIAVIGIAIISIPLAHKIHHPPVIFCVPPVIPMIPGYFAYKTVLSIMNFIFIETNLDKRIELIDAIYSNGFTMVFILISIAVGISLPMLILRKTTVKNI
ncbi:threonine/serine exporter family protein [Gaetbulibacter saemankumensis]|uniref:threonine/serine exporter family protein n=1 Tax=Gaetbulibacter saemankumensis TaxID=311208 RepID=UPI0004862FEC|nr:threonine/serine exporter family protein [Gaetbulibacter saemankumensis]